ncbi:hypothetical protein [Paenibacillus sp. tmac-D7]|uniref:hypothetical protein n=1 Tax=Paenibacillus sp. tmac-D7 TaxID=2591462 RepID=UPI00215A2AC5|nr:hypothetical protein [Paenibacillus sp. tmac-D7]
MNASNAFQAGSRMVNRHSGRTQLDDMEKRILQLGVKNRRLMRDIMQNAEALRATKEAVMISKTHMHQLWQQLNELRILHQCPYP